MEKNKDKPLQGEACPKHSKHEHTKNKAQTAPYPDDGNPHTIDEPSLHYQTNLEEKVLEYVQTAQRLQADFDNYRKKSLEQIVQAKYDGMIEAITKLIPVLDSIASAKKMIKEEKLLEGFVLIENQLLGAFTALGVEKIEALNQPFDPRLHNALAVQSNPELDDDIIIDEYQAGYKLKEKIIRYSQVIVNKKEE